MNKITVVTVCLNVEDSIRKTMDSVLNQTFQEIEYIIQDGGSTDKTLSIVKEYQQKYPFIRLYSEQDHGLYDAMNRALCQANGEYILFLNSKDVFCDAHVLEQMVPFLKEDIVIGNVIREKQDAQVIEKYRDKKQVFFMLLSGRMPCHQSIFTKTEKLRELQGFDETYSICADFDFMVRSFKQGFSVRTVDVSISTVDCVTGISSLEENLWKMRKQDDASLKAHYPIWYQMMRPVKFIKRKLIG